MNNDLLDDKQQVLIDLQKTLLNTTKKEPEKKEVLPPQEKKDVIKPVTPNPLDRHIGFGNNLDAYIPETISGDILVF